ncbi:hypothetical protein LINPERPRIM_LOCUS41038 [Linum perenne]
MGKSNGKGVASSPSTPPPAKKLRGTARRDTLQVASSPDNISSNIFSFPREDNRVMNSEFSMALCTSIPPMSLQRHLRHPHDHFTVPLYTFLLFVWSIEDNV